MIINSLQVKHVYLQNPSLGEEQTQEYARLKNPKFVVQVPGAKAIPPYRMGDQMWCAQATIGSIFCGRGWDSTLRNLYSSSFPQFINLTENNALCHGHLSHGAPTQSGIQNLNIIGHTTKGRCALVKVILDTNYQFLSRSFDSLKSTFLFD